jgi:hypothetical protein
MRRHLIHHAAGRADDQILDGLAGSGASSVAHGVGSEQSQHAFIDALRSQPTS